MGVDHHIRLLPYVEIEAKERTEERIITADCCGSSMRDYAFCPRCGKAKQSSAKQVPINYTYDIGEMIGERMYCPLSDGPTHCWIANITPKGYRHKEPDIDTSGAYPLPSDIEKVKADFAKAFAPEIEVLRKEYGAKPIVKFGLLVWFS